MRGCAAFVLATLVACGPDVGDAGASGEGSSSGGAETSGVSITSSSSASTADESTTRADTTGEGSSTTGEPLECEDHDPIDGCPEGCMDAWSYAAVGEEIDVANGHWVCVAAGDAIADGYRSTWWSDDAGEPRFLLSGHLCGVPITAVPIGWTECSGGADDPPQCAHACVQDVCPGDGDAALLQECAAESPCAPHEGCGAPDDLQCVLVALRDRVPGRYEFTIGFEYITMQPTQWLVVVADTGVAQATRKDGWQMACDAPLDGMWSPTASCTLADPQVFDDCLAGEDPCAFESCPGPDDVVRALLVDCIDMPASCP